MTPEPGAGPLDLTGVPRTLLIPLSARALDYRSKHPILHDAKADELARRLGLDLGAPGGPGRRRLLPVRARQFDEWTREFLARHPDAVVVHLGCGLDTRYFRVRPPPSVQWIEVDFPEVIALRRRFFEEGPSYRFLGASLTDPDGLRSVPGDRPGLAIADGVLEYLGEPDAVALIRRVVGHFPSGGFLFDVMGSSTVRAAASRLRASGFAEVRWAVDDVRTVDAIVPAWRRVANRSILATRYTPMRYRAAYVVLSPIPRFRRAFRLLRYEFGPSAGAPTAP